MIIVNFKIYQEAFGIKAIDLAKLCQQIGNEYNLPIYPAVSALDAVAIKKELKMKVLLQHVDAIDQGRFTGKISPLAAAAWQLDGSLINHSEDKQPAGSIRKLLRMMPDDFIKVVCVRSQKQAVMWAKKKIDFLAYEPSELIESKDKSVASEKPEAIKQMVKIGGKIPVLVGAGVKSRKDVEIALSLGAKGILVASGVVKSSDPAKQLRDLAEGFAIIR